MLTIQQTEYIEALVEKEHIHLSHLAFELIDHICCEVEHEMNTGIKFPDAIKKVETRIGDRGLKKIQDDTLYLIDKNYRIMKNVMKTTGIIGPALIGLGSLFKILHLPGAGIILTLGFLVLCLIFLPASASVLYKESKDRYSKSLFITGFLAAFLFSVGILWKIQHWPGAGIMLLVGDVIGILVFVPVLLISRIKESDDKKKIRIYVFGLVSLIIYLSGSLFKLMHWPGAAMLLFFGAIMLFGLVLPLYVYQTFKNETYVKGKFIFIVLASVWIIIHTALISLKVSGNLFSKYGVIYTDIVMQNDILEDENADRYTVITANDNNNAVKAIRDESQNLVAQIRELRSDISRMDEYREDADLSGSPFTYLRNPDDQRIPFQYMIGPEKDGKAIKLEKDLNSYTVLLESTLGKEDLAALVAADLKEDLAESGWAEKRFSNTLGFTLNYLALLEFRVLEAESEAYLFLINNDKIEDK